MNGAASDTSLATVRMRRRDRTFVRFILSTYGRPGDCQNYQWKELHRAKLSPASATAFDVELWMLSREAGNNSVRKTDRLERSGFVSTLHRTDSRQPSQRLPMPWMGTASARADLSRVRF